MTRTRALRLFVALSVAAVAAFWLWPSYPLFAQDAMAIQSSCKVTQNGSYCSGTLKGFRDLPGDSYARIYLLNTGPARFSFVGLYDDRLWECNVTNSDRAGVLNATFGSIRPNDHFWIWWDSSGTCKEVYLYKFSDEI